MAELALDRFAAVGAALAEGFPLADVLAIEGLDAAAWTEAELAWTARLSSDPAELARYGEALDAAQDRLARKVTPLDDDVAAWVAFLAAFSSATDAAELLAAHALGMNDLSRLRRRWAKRVEADRGVEKKMEQLKKRGPGALPKVRVEPPRLRPSPRAEAERAAAAKASTGAAHARLGGAAGAMGEKAKISAPPLTLDRYAMFAAERAAPRADAARVLARFGLSSAEADALDEVFHARFASDVELERDFTRLRAHHAARLAAAAVPAPKPALLSAPRVDPAAFSREAVVRAPSGKPAAERTVIGASPFKAALPFATSSAGATSEIARPTRVAVGQGSDGGTVTAPSPFAPSEAPFDERTSALPGDFAPYSADAAPVSSPASTSRGASPPSSRATWRTIGSTVTAVLSPFGEALPFAPGPASSSEPVEADDEDFDLDDEETSMIPVSSLGVEAPVTISDEHVLLDFEDAPQSFVPDAPPVSVAELLPLERHASLCVEIALDGAPDAALARYGVSAEVKARADAHFRDMFLRDPALRAAWNRAFDVYRGWYAARRS